MHSPARTPICLIHLHYRGLKGRRSIAQAKPPKAVPAWVSGHRYSQALKGRRNLTSALLSSQRTIKLLVGGDELLDGEVVADSLLGGGGELGSQGCVAG